MRVAVTGAAGFIGRHVLNELASRGVDTLAVVRTPGSIAEMPANRVVGLDITAPQLDTFSLLGSPDTLIHLAWGGLSNFQSRRHFEVEMPRHYGFLRNLVESGLPNLFVAGTCLEYGMQSGCLSEDLPAQPYTSYGFAKDALRRQLEFLGRDYGYNLTWGRLFYLYGDGQGATSLYAQLQAAAKRGDQVFGMSDGEQLRDYLPVAEVARYIVDLALAGKPHGVVNICSGKPVSVRRLVEGWMEEHGWSMTLKLGRYPYPEYEPLAFWGDSTKVAHCLRRAGRES